ncbi:MAG: 3'-5' exonuclease [Gammaproteobacteria bacterium]|nr:3'-5' exonuclease [Gammaproteobacteria bacterium]
MIKQWFQHYRYKKDVQRYRDSELMQLYCPPNIELINQQTFCETEFLVLDFETTGLNPKKDRVLSVGWTTISKGCVQLGTSEHYYIKHTERIPDKSVTIHHITEEEAANGVPITEIFPHLLKQLNGKVLVAHFADIEIGFLQQIAKNIYSSTLPLQTLDTLHIAYCTQYKDSVHIPANALNLSALRKEHKLPRYKAHNAMQDAVATAELLLVQVELLGGANNVRLKKLLSL